MAQRLLLRSAVGLLEPPPRTPPRALSGPAGPLLRSRREARAPAPALRLVRPEERALQEPADPLLREWEDLARRLRALPFLRPGWISAWWDAFGAGGLEIRTVVRDGRLAAVLPMRRGWGRLRSTGNCHTPQLDLLAEDPDAAAALARSLFRDRPHRVSIGGLDASGTGLRALVRAAEDAGYRVLARPQQRAPYLAMGDGWPAFTAGLRPSLLRNVRRARHLLESHGAVSFEVADGRERLDVLLGEALEVEGSGWKGFRGTAIRSRLDTRRFYTGVARWAAAEGLLRLFFLRLDGRPVAMLFALVDGGVCHLLKGGYDPAYRRSSPGMLLLHHVLAHGFSAGWSRIDLHGDADPYKLRWTRTVQERVRFDAFAPSPAGRLAWLTVAYGRPAARRLLGRRGRPQGPSPDGAAIHPETDHGRNQP